MQPILIPDRLKAARESLGITKLEASKRMNITQASYVRYEKGDRNPTHATIIQMAQVLETNVDYLVGISDDPSSDSIVIDKKTNPTLFAVNLLSKDLDEKALKRLQKYCRELARE